MKENKQPGDNFLNNLSETIVAISKGGAYDAIKDDYARVKEENERLRKALRIAYDALQRQEAFLSQPEWEQIETALNNHK